MPAYKDNKKGTWYVKCRYKDWTGNTRWCTKRGFSTKRDALSWEREFQSQRAGDIDMDFASFVKLYQENSKPRIKESTSITKENIVTTKILPYFGKKPLSSIRSTDVLQWQNVMLSYRDPKTGKPYSMAYLKTLHNQLSAIFNHAVRYYGLKENPARLAGNMGSEKGIEMKFWTRDEYQCFLEQMMDEPLAYYVFETLYWTGMREGEMMALTPGDIDLKGKKININKTFQHLNGRDVVTDPKTPKAKRKITIPDFLCEELEEYMAMCMALEPTDRLFPVSKSYLYRMMEKGCKAAGVQRIRVHDIRHSHVSLLIDMGFSVLAIADRMGHESSDITYRYAHLFPSVQAQMADELNKFREEENGNV